MNSTLINELTYKAQLDLIENSPLPEVLEKLSMSQYLDVRIAVAKLSLTTSDILTKMLKYTTSIDVVNAIFENPNFKLDYELIKELSKSSFYFIRQKIAEYPETTFEILEEMLVLEDDEEVITAIINHPNFSNDSSLKKIFKILINLEDRKIDYIEAFNEIKFILS